MGRMCSRDLQRHLWFSFFLLIFVLSQTAVAFGSGGNCVVEQCSKAYSRVIEMDRIKQGPYLPYCKVLKTYAECVHKTARPCRGHLQYHSISSLVHQWNIQFNCTLILENPELARDPETDTTPHFRSGGGRGRHQQCVHHRPHEFRHCSLFGDPHLRTFNDEYQTCKVLGAWPLVDNPYLAVQVTNEEVRSGVKATATTKVTVIIKSHGQCAQERTYEAQSGNLPSAFIDGTVSSGLERSVRIKEKDPGRHVEIFIRYVATTVVIRQIGKYLTVSMRMPHQIVNQGDKGDLSGLQLCLRGCPVPERIDYQATLLYHDDRGGAMSRDQALSLCQANNVTDFYLDSCVFDLMTTGDITFLQAAHIALKDLRALNPSLAANQENRLSLPAPTEVKYNRNTYVVNRDYSTYIANSSLRTSQSAVVFVATFVLLVLSLDRFCRSRR